MVAWGVFPQLHQSRHVTLTPASRLGFQEALLGKGAQQYRDPASPRLVMDDAEILNDEVDRRSACEVPGDESRNVPRHHGRAPARGPNHIQDDLGISSKLDTEDRGFGNRRRVYPDQQLVDQFHCLPRARWTAESDVLAECLENWKHPAERLRVAADHDGERPRRGAARSA